jgi:hypothetical protein
MLVCGYRRKEAWVKELVRMCVYVCVIKRMEEEECEEVSGRRESASEELLCYLRCLASKVPLHRPTTKTYSSYPPAKPEWADAVPLDEHSPVATSLSRVLTLLLVGAAIRHTRQWKSRISLTDGVAVVSTCPWGTRKKSTLDWLRRTR